MAILSADDQVCIFVLFVIEKRLPWLMLSLAFTWFRLHEFSLFDTL